jgi:cytochrome c biogenesis protein CcdA
MIKLILLFVFGLGFLFLVIVILGEDVAKTNKHPRFTRWWRKYAVGEESELD